MRRIRIAAVSDIHGEFRKDPEMHQIANEILETNPDIIILAGDTHTGVQSARWASQAFSHSRAQVVMVAGNHEYYSRKIDTLDKKLRGHPNVTFLQNESVVIHGIHISGTTLWADGNGNRGNPTIEYAIMATGMNDYRRIRVAKSGYGKLTPAHTIRHHHLAVEFLAKEATTATRPWIVVTHHAPTFGALEHVPEAKHDTYPTGTYASNLEDSIKEWNPDLWIFGHIHQPGEFQIGQTRLINVSRGYPGEEKSALTVIEIEIPE